MISLCITTYNRTDLLFDSFMDVIYDPRITEVIIVDDHSPIKIYDTISVMLEGCHEGAGYKNDPFHKVKLHYNDENLGMSLNKARAVELATNEWCILLDSDNIIDSAYLDAIPFGKMNREYIYCPSFAKPQFDYRKYAGMAINSDVAKKVMSKPMGECLFNTCNYVVNRQEYLRVYEYNADMKGTDTIWFNYLWLRSGGKFFVLQGMEYFHRVHAGSGFMADVDYNMKKAAEVKQLIQTLR